MQLLGDDHKLYLLRRTDAGEYRAVTSQSDWPSYNGQTTGSRYSDLTQIKPANAAQLQPRWIFTLRNTREIQSTPIVADGVMYVTSANESAMRSTRAVDARSGTISAHAHPVLPGSLLGGANRGAAIAAIKSSWPPTMPT